MMTLSEYINYFNDALSQAKYRILMVPPKTGPSLRMFYKQHRGIELYVSSLIHEDARLPMPEELFERIACVLNEKFDSSSPVIVVGLWGYATLLAEMQQQSVFAILKKWIDETPFGKEVVFLLWRDELMEATMKQVFDNPRYTLGKNFIAITPESGEPKYADTHTEVILVGELLANLIPKSCTTLQKYLRHTEEQSPLYSHASAAHRVILASEHRVAGLRSDILQLLSLHDFMSTLYNISPTSLSDEALLWMCQIAKHDQHQDMVTTLMETFFPDGDLTSNALRVFESNKGCSREVLLWLLLHTVTQGSYLAYVLQQEDINTENFRSAYVTCACQWVDASAQHKKERLQALQRAGIGKFSTDISTFITYCTNKNTSEVAPWLHGQTDTEYCELLRRCAQDGYATHAVKDAYPALAAYLSDIPVFEDVTIEEYFKDYRALKITNSITEAFYTKANNIDPPATLSSRDATVQRYAADSQCALLVVDAMGAEWLPMLTVLAQERNIGIESLTVCKAQLPTTTHHNPLHWPSLERRLGDIKRLDNIAHNGAEKHEAKKPHENLAAALAVIDDAVLSRVQDGLARFERVVVTADHGTSRLAVLARQTEPRLARTLICEDAVDVADSRYRAACQKNSCPQGLVETRDGDYWIVRGYDRLPKQGGGNSFEVHGGASLEEMLVPVVVFSRKGQFVPKAKTTQKNSQVVENPDFDI